MRFKTYIIVSLFLPYFLITGCKTQNENTKGVVMPVSREVSSIKPTQNISIHQAALDGQLSQLMELLVEGLNVNSQDKEGRTALMYAAFNGHTEIIRKLIEKGALVNLCDIYGRTALMMGSSGPYPDAVKVLLDHQADPNIADKEEHFTALMYAAAEGQSEVAKLLLAYRADPFLKDVDGDDAMTFADNNGHREVTVLLQSIKK